MKAKDRALLRTVIEENALAFSVAFIDNNIIDKVNILQATYKAMHQCIDTLKIKPERLLIDGNRFLKYKNTPHECIVKGDGKYMSIAAASVLAKTYRDELMQKLGSEYPQYGWEKNKGYGTALHREAIEAHGLCKYHRKSFRIQPTANSDLE